AIVSNRSRSGAKPKALQSGIAGPMTKTKRRVLVGALLFLPWLLTGGCVVIDSEYRFVDSYNNNYRPWIRVATGWNHRTSGIPLLFTYTDNVPPYDATFFYYTQDVVEGAVLVIDKIAIRYSDGTEADLTAQVEKTMIPKPDEMWYIEDHVEVRRPCLRAK